MRKLMAIIGVVVGINFACVQAAVQHDEDHKSLTALRETTREAINTRNFDMLKPYLVSENLTVITVDGKKCESLAAFRDYWSKLFEVKAFGLDRIEVNPVADGPTEFLSDNVGVCHGTSNDRYFFKNGDVRTMPERWTAVMVKDGAGWKISRIIFSANILDNPVLTAVKQEMEKLILIAGIGGCLLGALIAWLVFRKKA